MLLLNSFCAYWLIPSVQISMMLSMIFVYFAAWFLRIEADLFLEQTIHLFCHRIQVNIIETWACRESWHRTHRSD